jgi:hypothetical protein
MGFPEHSIATRLYLAFDPTDVLKFTSCPSVVQS